MKKLITLLLLSLSFNDVLTRIDLQSTYQLTPDAKAAGLLHLIDKKATRDESTDAPMQALIQLLAAADQAGLDLESTELVQEALREANFEKNWKEHNSLYKAAKRNIINNPNAILPFIIQGAYYSYKAYQTYNDPTSYQNVVMIHTRELLNRSDILREFMSGVANSANPITIERAEEFAVPIIGAAIANNLMPEIQRPGISDPNQILGLALGAVATSCLCLMPHARRTYTEWCSQDHPPLLYLEGLEEEIIEETDLEKLEREKKESDDRDGMLGFAVCALAPIAMILIGETAEEVAEASPRVEEVTETANVAVNRAIALLGRVMIPV